jgi:tRNA pseudouridine38-40 synthase
MGVSWSKETKAREAETPVRATETPIIATIEHSAKVGQKRAAEPDNGSSLKKKKQYRDKRKERNDKAEKKETVQTRPQHDGPRDPRVPKKKVALLIGFNGTGFQGMQLYVVFLSLLINSKD